LCWQTVEQQFNPALAIASAVSQHIKKNATTMTTQDVIELLKKRETEYSKTEYFSQLPGIYAFFFIGNTFPLIGSSVSKHQIIYVGKTESSQEKRDAKTHFTTGKTGSSTVRKSIGSILYEQENLKPIPRNDSDYEKGRLSHFMFDDPSEHIITNWMKNNLALSFYEYPKSRQEIEDLETELIHVLVPILNISKNPKNQFKDTLQQFRKNCAQIASRNQFQKGNIEQTNFNKPQQIKSNMSSSGKYIDLWTKNRSLIKEKLVNSSTKQMIRLNSEDFSKVGKRSSYSFNLEYKNGIVNNNIDGSAVARDLAKVLENSAEIKTILNSGDYKINMDRMFCLWLEKL
jgi:hypothetical protein